MPSGRRRAAASARSATPCRRSSAAEGGNFRLAPWDWRYYAEKLRKARFDLDESEIKPYLPLDSIIEAAFYTANRLFGLTFTPRNDVPVYHPDVRVWEVTGPDGRHIGVFFGDYFARPSKRSGAWMTSLRDQEQLDGEVRPLVLNVMNFNKGAKGEPTLLSFDDARTLFHEFGHGLHGLMSDVTYPMISGTGVLQDFVELPSQLYEHWLDRPEILERFARHYKTGEPMPRALMDRLIASRTFNQGFLTTEYLGSTYVDLDFHLGGAKDAAQGGSGDARRACRCPKRSCCGTARRTSSTSSRATAMRPATTAICGPRCWTRTRSTPSRRPATCSTPRSRAAARPHLRGGRRPRAGRGLSGVPRPDALGRSAAAQARPCGRGGVNLHTAGHRRGVVAAPHHAAAETGRLMLEEGGNALEAMVAMAATIAAVYPHMNHIGGDAFWLVREPSGRVRAIMGAGPAGAKATPALYREHGFDANPAARAARRADRAGRGRHLDARVAGRRGLSRQAAARRAVRPRDPPCARGLHGDAQPGAAHRRKACRVPRRAGLCQDVPRSTASRRPKARR